MLLMFDPRKWRSAVWHGVLADPIGRAGLIAACVLCGFAPIAGMATKYLIDAAWEGSYDYDSFVAYAFAWIVVALFVAAAFVFARRSWSLRSSGVGSVRSPLVNISRGWLTYSFRVMGDIHLNARNIIVVRLSSRQTSVRVDPGSGMVCLEGGVWRYLDFDISNPGTRLLLTNGAPLPPTGGAVPPIEQLEHVGAFRIPDIFTPDLYQSVLANFE